MGKSLFIAEKPSVAMEFASALGIPKGNRQNGYTEDDDNIVTWCVGHLITMSYPEKYDPSLAQWELDTLPFIPKDFKYEIIKDVESQYRVVQKLLNREDVDKIYYSGDSAREGEYIQRLVRAAAGHNPNAKEYRVWIDSQTEEEILNGIRNAHELSYYDSLGDSAYARAIEDYLVGINFSRALSLLYARSVSNMLSGGKYHAIAVGRVMSCVLGMVVERERLIRGTKTIPFYSLKTELGNDIVADWKIVEGSKFFGSPDVYDNKGLLKEDPAKALADDLNKIGSCNIVKRNTSTEKKFAPLLFNLAELQSECTKAFHISPSDTLAVAQSLYEKKLTTYPRTDARVLTNAICKEIDNNIGGLKRLSELQPFAEEVLDNGWHTKIASTKYVDDSKVSDHYAIIPTGQGFENIGSLSPLERNVYILIAHRFLSIFYPPSEYEKTELQVRAGTEVFSTSVSALKVEGWQKVTGHKDAADDLAKAAAIQSLVDPARATFSVKKGESQPPKRYTTGSMILAMENAGNLIEDEDLRAQIKGSGIGTSATRADTIAKLEKNGYIVVNKKTQVITPGALGEGIYVVLKLALPNILNPKYTASWETGLQQIVDKKIDKDVYLEKIYGYVRAGVKEMKDKNLKSEIETEIQNLKSVYPEIGKAAAGTSAVCPNCGKPLKFSEKSLYCTGYKEGCRFSLWRTMAGKKFTDKDLEGLVDKIEKKEGKLTMKPSKVFKGFKSKAGKSFDARLSGEDSGEGSIKLNFVFENSGGKK